MSTDAIWSLRAMSDAMPMLIGDRALDTDRRERPRAERLLDTVRENLRALVVRVGREDFEFLAAVAGDHVAESRGLAEQPAHLAQHLVAGEMAVLVVDALEVIHVEREHRKRLAPAHRARHFTRRKLVEPAPVETSAERIGQHDRLEVPAHPVVRAADDVMASGIRSSASSYCSEKSPSCAFSKT